MVEKHQCDQDRRGGERKAKKETIDTNDRTLIGRGQACSSHWNSETQIRIRGREPFSDRPISCAKIQSVGCHCCSTRPLIPHTASHPCGREVRGIRTNQSKPNGPYCNSSPPVPESRLQLRRARPSASGDYFSYRRIPRCRHSARPEYGRKPSKRALFPCPGRMTQAARRPRSLRLCLR